MLIKPLNQWIKTTFNGVPLRTLLIVPFFLQILGTVGIVGYLSYRSGQQVVEELTNQLMTEIGDRITQNLDDYLHTSIDITQINAKTLNSGSLDWQNKSQLEDYFVEQINTFSQVGSVYIATEQKDFLIVAKPQPDSLVIREWNPRTGDLENYVADLQGNRLYLRDTIPNYDPQNDPPTQPWYPIAKAAKNGTWQTVTSGVKKSNLILVLVRSLPFYDSQGNFQGVVGATVFLDKMSEFLSQLKIGKTGQAFIMDNRGYLIATSTDELPFRVTDFSPKLETSDPQKWRLSVENSHDPVTQTVGKYVRSKLDYSNSINYNAVKLPIPEQNQRYCIRVIPYSLDEDSNWFIVVTVPESDFMGTIKTNIYRTVLLWCIIALFIKFSVAILAAKLIVKPLKILNIAAQQLAENHFEHPLQKSSIKEVNQLTNSFSQMAEQLTASFQALKLSEQRFSVLLDSVPIGVSVFDNTGQHIFINKVGQQILGQGIQKIPPEQLSEVYQVYISGKNQLYPTEKLPGIRALKGEKVHVDDIEIGVNVIPIPLEVTSIPVFDESGTVVYSINMFQDITERRQNEQLRISYQQQLEQEIAERTLKLQKSEERLNLVIAAMGEGIWDWDIIKNTAWWSPQYYELVGLSVAEIEADPVPQFYNRLHPNDRDRFQQLLTNHLENNHPYIIELRLQQPDGRYRWFLAKGQALRDENGEPYRMVGSFADISDRKQAEELLHQSEARYLSILEYQTELVTRFQPDGRLSYVNEAFCRYYGVSREEAIGHCYKPRIYPEDQPIIDRCLTQLSPQEPVGIVEHRVIVNGEVRWMQWTNQAIYDTEGNLVELQSVGRDIDDLKRAEELLHQSEARYLSILEYQTEFITRFQADGTLSYVNDAYCRYFGISKEDFLGHHYQPIIYPEDQATIDGCLAELSPEQPVFTIENRVVVNGEPRWTQWTNQAIYDTEGNLVELQSVGRDIDDRKKAEIALQKTTEQLQAFLDNAPAIIHLFDAEGRYLQVNQAFLKLFNLPEQQIIGRTFADFFPEDVVNLFNTRVQELIENGKPLIVEDKLVINGECKIFQSILFPVKNEGVRPQTFWSIVTDISERKQAELELRQSRDLRDAIFHESADALFLVDSDSLLTIDCNRRAIEMFEAKNKEELIGIEGHTLQKRQFTPAELEKINQDIEQKGMWSLEVEYITKTSRHFWGNLAVKQIKIVGQRLNLVRVTDISDLKYAEQALSESEKQLRLLADALPVFISYADCDERYQFVNRKYEEQFGMSREEICGKTTREIVGKVNYHLVRGYIQQALAGESVSYEVTLPGSETSENRHLSVMLIPNFDEDLHVRGYYSLIIDISDRKRMELELQKAKDTAEAASQAKGAFIANMSHELRSPLNAILGFARLLKNDPQLSSEQIKNADIIYRSGEHLLNLINQVLDLAKIEANRTTLDPTDFNLDKLLEDIYSMFSLKAESKGLHLNVQKNPDVPRYIRTDEMKLRQVLINLLSNAVKFTNHGSITLRVIVASPSSDHNIILNFEVEDTGVGIAPAEKTRLFEAFSQTEAGRKIQEGTGLGLTISREFVKLMGGNISVESQLNVGSLFRFNIAAKIVDAVPPTSPVSEQKIISLAPGQPLYRLLVADDNFANRRLLVQLLTPLGFAVQEAENGEEAITLWEQWQPHLIWMDLRMPVLDGWEATKQIRHLEQCQYTTNPVKIIAVSANRLSDYETLGFNDFIHKPFEELEIFTALEQHLGVKYSYAKSVPETSQNPVNRANSTEAIANLPAAVLKELQEALILGDPQLIQQIIQSVEKENSNLAAVLTPLAEQFEYGRILDLIRSVRSVR
ncbi:MAG: PAS domain S-box protein [Lyngbya sp.]|nr:PAS domain S-box protein [Lyngbya sp.]